MRSIKTKGVQRRQRSAPSAPPRGAKAGGRAREEAIVIGAGAAGLGVAGELDRRGIKALLLERSRTVGGGWHGRYESLRLNTIPRFSSLPGTRIKHAGRWMPGIEFGRYLERYARERSLRVQTGVEVHRVERERGGWKVDADAGAFDARSVVVATGHDLVPELPNWPGRDEFEGALIHSAQYRRPEPYIGRDVLV